MRLSVMTPGFLTVAFLMVGCAPADKGPAEPAGAKATVTGKISHNGAALTKGTLNLDSGKGYMLGAKINPDGTFELMGPNGKDVIAGSYKVGVSPPPNPAPAPGAKEMPPRPSIEGVPEKFYNPNTSGVTVEIKEGKQEIAIDLK